VKGVGQQAVGPPAQQPSGTGVAEGLDEDLGVAAPGQGRAAAIAPVAGVVAGITHGSPGPYGAWPEPPATRSGPQPTKMMSPVLYVPVSCALYAQDGTMPWGVYLAGAVR
jgi:hypothetical protein